MTAPGTTIVWTIGGRLDRAHIPRLCREFGALLGSSGARVVVCDVGGLIDPDCVAVDAVARLQLAARRRGATVTLLRASNELKELLELIGLENVIRHYETLLVDPLGEPEHREQVLGVEEEIEPDDPPV
ncbi:MAG: STAS domain-containing protein [Actinobacteria bacterium]|nr:STAS domain-containing protein [Actinomycetota bacterium]